VLGLFGGKKRKEERAKKCELVGQLDKAIGLYLEAELPDDAARVLLLKADAEVDPNKRMVLCAQAARVGESTPHGKQARKRKALLGFDLVKGARGATMRGELLRAAEELEAADEWQAAAEAYALVGDTDNEIRVLKEAGAIERLEDRLWETSEKARRERDRTQLIRRLRDLDIIAERRAALHAGRQWLARGADEQVQLEVDRIANRLLAGPSVVLDLRGSEERFVLGSEVTIGRTNADIVVASSAVSRQHLRLSRVEGQPRVTDLDTRNGTMLAGARVSGSLPIGEGLELSLAGRVPCTLTPLGTEAHAPVVADVAGARYLLPLGPLQIGHWSLVDAHDGDDRFVVLRTLDGHEPPHMAGYRLAYQIELCIGDRFAEQRDGPVILEVPPQPSAM
jgi:hypothetical protein